MNVTVRGDDFDSSSSGTQSVPDRPARLEQVDPRGWSPGFDWIVFFLDVPLQKKCFLPVLLIQF